MTGEERGSGPESLNPQEFVKEPPPPLWRDKRYITTLTAAVPALVAVLTWATNYTIEKSKLAAQEASQQTQLAQAKQARLDENAAAEQARLDELAAAQRALQTKYVDMALGRTMCIDYRARIFGFLAAVLSEPEQRDWAKGELKRTVDRQQMLSGLREKLDAKREASVSLTAEFAKKYGKSGLAKDIAEAFLLNQKHLEDEIVVLQKRISEAEGPPCEHEHRSTIE